MNADEAVNHLEKRIRKFEDKYTDQLPKWTREDEMSTRVLLQEINNTRLTFHATGTAEECEAIMQLEGRHCANPAEHSDSRDDDIANRHVSDILGRHQPSHRMTIVEILGEESREHFGQYGRVVYGTIPDAEQRKDGYTVILTVPDLDDGTNTSSGYAFRPDEIKVIYDNGDRVVGRDI